MKDIYDIFESRQDDLLELEYQRIQESHDNFVLLEKEIYRSTLIENMVYNNPDKKRLDVLIEEAEVKRETDLITMLKEQMKKVLNWIMNIFGKYKELFDEGANFVKQHDLNKYMMKIKQQGNIPTIQYHSSKSPFPNIKTKCLRAINSRMIAARLVGGTNSMAQKAEAHNNAGDLSEETYESMLEKFKLTENHLNNIRLDQVNVITVHNTLTQLPAANKELEGIKRKVQDVYNKSINMIQRIHSKDKTENKTNMAKKDAAILNSDIKKLNEMIRAYAKIMYMTFNEDYKVARDIVNVANGGQVKTKNKEDEQKQKTKKVIPLGNGKSSTKADSGSFSSKRK